MRLRLSVRESADVLLRLLEAMRMHRSPGRRSGAGGIRATPVAERSPRAAELEAYLRSWTRSTQMTASRSWVHAHRTLTPLALGRR